jgi:hypothetical protein
VPGNPTLDILLLFLQGLANRELYHRDYRRRWQGIDTGFGVFSQPTASRSAVVSAITNADVAPGKGDSDSDAIQLEVPGRRT